MLYINKITSDTTVDFSAEELKKYLRMMMPEGGDVKINYAPEAKDGFRLGLMQDFGLDTSDAKDTFLDDIVYIDCDTEGGIIAGDNPRSVLIAVYEYLRQNGCRWLMPGVDGEFIPIKDINPVKYRHAADCRYRGWCDEGAQTQRCMLETIDFGPKVGLNSFMLERFVPYMYYAHYYDHLYNNTVRKPEPITKPIALQWTRELECEMSKRGLQYHAIGHDWTARALKVDFIPATDKRNDELIPDEKRQFIAKLNGKRALTYPHPSYINPCFSNEVGRRNIVSEVCDYAESHSNITYLHIWLADGTNNHCECEECAKKTPSDWYVEMLNEIDEELTRRSLGTKIMFIAYVDTTWAPEKARFKNPDRFSLLFAPIFRSYTETLPKVPSGFKPLPYKRNKNVFPRNLEENFAYLDEWKKLGNFSMAAFEYHFWVHQYRETGGIELSERLNEDIKVYKEKGVNGLIQDGSHRSGFPTGLPFYTYARTMFDNTLSARELAEDYLKTAFLDKWEFVYDYLREIGEITNAKYMERELSSDINRGSAYNPEYAKQLSRLDAVLQRGRAFIKENYNYEHRLGTVSVRLLEFHAEYLEILKDILAAKAVGEDAKAFALLEEAKVKLGKKELEFESYYDQFLLFAALNQFLSRPTKDATDVV